jgi:predicted metal-dependent phosphoesterase TrpH
MEKMIAKLTELGMPLKFSEVAIKAGGSIGRPHLAEVMVEKGYVESKTEAFELWIGDGLPAHVIQPKPSIREAVEMVKKCGGITSLAHPIYYGIPPAKLVDYCFENGVDSIEAFHRSHPDDYRYQLWQYCKQKSLSVSCGSDFHGESYGQTPGSMATPIAELCF